MATSVQKSPLYRVVADHVEDLVTEGTLLPGSRVPSLRKMSRQASVSLTTVMEAYRLLEDRGVIEARPQSGHYVRLDPRLSPPEPAPTWVHAEAAPLDVGELIARLVAEASQPDLRGPFGAAIPSAEFLPIRQINTMLGRVVRRDPVASQSYDSVPGRLELRREIARRAIEAGCSLSPDDVVITTGATEAITLALRTVTRPGDTVAIETPTYHGFLQALESLHLKAREITTHPRRGLCVACLEQAIETEDVAACLITGGFGNPLGHSMPDEKRRRLTDLIAKTGTPLIEDDTYGDLPFDERRPPTVQSFDDSGNVLLLSSFTKTLAPGYRVGWIAPGRFKADLLRTKFSASIATAAPTQMAIAEYLATGGIDRHLRRLRRTFKDLVRRMITAVGEYFPPGTRVSRPAGGYVLWVEMPETVDSFELYRQALAEDISIMPGPLFSASGRYVNCLRLNCAIPWSVRIEDAVRRLGTLAAKQL